jgi:hypothetical protein
VSHRTQYEGTQDSTYTHLYFKPRRIRAHEDPRNAPIRANRCVQVYFSTLRKSNGEPSKKTYYGFMTAARQFLEFHRLEATDHVLDDLIEAKVRNPNDTTAERMVSLFRAKCGDQVACAILGLYHRNFADVKMHISIKSNGKTVPLSEPQLLAIYSDSKLSEEHRLIIDLMAFAGERISALSMTEPKNVYLVEGTQSALLDIEAHLNKMDTGHPCIIPKELAERILENIQTHQYQTLFPNYRSLFQHITRVAKESHSVRFTSHYLRKRFQTIGSSTNANDMSPNKWASLMGDAPSVGHLPTIYELIDNKETIEQYEEFLEPRLKLGERQNKTESKDLKLQRRIDELIEQNSKLVDLISKTLKA